MVRIRVGVRVGVGVGVGVRVGLGFGFGLALRLGVGLALGLVLGLGIASSTVASSTAHLRCRGGDLCRGDAGMRGGLDARERDGHVLVEQGEQQHECALELKVSEEWFRALPVFLLASSRHRVYNKK